MQTRATFRTDLKIIEYKQFGDRLHLRFESKKLAQKFKAGQTQDCAKVKCFGSLVMMWFYTSSDTKKFMISLYEKETQFGRNFIKYATVRRDGDSELLIN